MTGTDDTRAGALARVEEATTRLEEAVSAQRAAVLEALEEGAPLRRVALAARVSRQTVYNWQGSA